MGEEACRVRLSGALAAQGGPGASYRVTVIAAGAANGWDWPAETLRAAAGAGLFAEMPSFLDHRHDPTLIGARSVRDLCGMVVDGVYDAERGAVRAVFRAVGPLGEWVDRLIRDSLAEQAADRPVPPLGLSIDVSFSATGRRVERIVRVHSADVVYHPAAGGAFEARLTVGEREAWSVERSTGLSLHALRSTLHETQEDTMTETNVMVAETTLSQALLTRQCAATLSAALVASDLPAPLREEVRAQFEGRSFAPDELDAALSAKRATWAALAEAGAVRGAGSPTRPAGLRRGASVEGMWTELERVQAAVDRLFGLPPAGALADAPRLSGIRELYRLVTGDHDLYGVFNAERAAFANANATTMANLVANAMNKVIPARAEELGQAGYAWWKPLVHEEDFTTVQDIRWITVGGFGDLPTVAEGAAYSELAWDDNAETTPWTKKGGYVGLTLEMIDRDETRRIRQIPYLLATSALRTLSGAVASLFTQNSGAGPELADTTALFHASRGNVGTAALTAATWDAAVQTMFKMTEMVSGKRLGIRPRFLLVPIELEKAALQIFASATEPSSNVFYENVRRSAAANVVTVPEWTDANDWAAVADPRIAPGIGVGYRFGRQPEVFVADQPTVGSMFTNDELRIKTRFFYGVGVVDYRPLYKANVA